MNLNTPKKKWVLLTEKQICFVFVHFVRFFFFFANFFVVPAQLRREMAKFLIYLKTGTGRRNNIFLYFTELERGPLSSAPKCFPFC